jgi:hypothetical protein
MAAFAPTAVCHRAPRAALVLASLVICLPLLTSCDQHGGELPRQIDGMKADLEESKRRIDHLQKSLAAKDSELAVNTQALDTANKGVTDLEQALNERNAQLRAAKIELDELKKKDAFAFGEIAATQGQGSVGLAVARYQKFITDFPKSPLVAHANNAITQLTTQEQESTPRTVARTDPAKREKDFARSFNEGYMTLQELAPFLKKKSLAQVLALCGRPNQTYNEGREIGYADRAINPTTGSRGMLIVSFEDGTVSTLRVEYGGRKFAP